MTINVEDVKLLKSQRLTDEEDGGGRATGDAVTDGEVNNLFPDISRLDRTLGRISLRKTFAGVMTDNADPYLGVHSIITKGPADPRVSVLLFNTGSQTDERVDARSVIEGYVVPSTIAQFELLGDQYAGQRTITGIQRLEARLPEIGEVYQLVHGLVNQYVRIGSVEGSEEEFIIDYGGGNFITITRRRLTLGITSPLTTLYPGGQVTPAGTSEKNLSGEDKSKVRATEVADSARYYGISQLAQPALSGDMTVVVDSVYSQLVPSATRESALTNQSGGARARYLVPSTPDSRSLTLSFTQVTSGQSRAFLTTGAFQLSVELSISGGIYADDGKGELTHRSGSNSFSRITVDYESGEINAFRSSTFTGSASVNYRPATAISGQAITGEIDITLGSRGFAYTLNLANAKPRPGTLSVSFMALGKWYELRDQGNGELTGEGSGTVDFASGSVSVSLNALPDVGTSLIYSYIGQLDNNLQTHVGSGSAPEIRVEHRLPHDGIQPGSLATTVTMGGSAKPLTDNGDGTLTGEPGTGRIVYATGEVSLLLTATPDAGSTVQFAYERAGHDIDTPMTASPDTGGIVSGTIAGAPLEPGSVNIRWQCQRTALVPSAVGTSGGTYTGTVTVEHEANDDGAGNWQGYTGSINYSTGAFSLKVEQLYDYAEYDVKYDLIEV
ncbi:hypothetical protein [Pseudomonas sp. gcc21]|uniref:hypothetical protein n=1 Tax=Pseudomonas sp. gcc21 TaxID=2726989 RepID=UPI00146E4ADF|nr:hypothetical protein [Pseudomonas sp. gcc21]